MATGTVPAAVPDPPDNTSTTTAPGTQPRGLLASMVAAVDPARPTFDLTPTHTPAAGEQGRDGALDRSAPGVSSDTFRSATEQAGKAKDPAGARQKRSIWKEMWLAAATRLAKGGGAANKRLDLAKARAQAHQVKETRTTTVTKSGGLPVSRNSGGSGGGTDKGAGKAGGKTLKNSPVNLPGNSAGNRSNGAGHPGAGGSTGGRGPAGTGGGSGGSGSGSGSAGRGGKGDRHPGTGRPGDKDRSSSTPSSGGKGAGKEPAGTERTTKTPNGPAVTGAGGGKHAPGGQGGASGKTGAAGKNGKDGSPGTGAGRKDTHGKVDLTKQPKPTDTAKTSTNKDSDKTRSPHADPRTAGQQHTPATKDRQQAVKTPLEKSRETGHGDGTKARRVVDHVKAYADGARDGWTDEKTKNAQEHARLDNAHATHQPPTRPKPVIVTEKGDDGVTTDVKPLTVTSIDANTLTLGADSVRTTVGRRELRNFKQYERKLEAKETILQKIAEACAQLATEADDEAKSCQDLAEQAKGVQGGEKLSATLIRLADAAKTQATEATDLAQRARRAAEMCKAVLANVHTRYAPLYQAVVDSDETKPAETRFYNDKNTATPAAA